MTALQLGLVLVASIWAAVNTLIAGYKAVNGTRDQVITGHTGEGVPLTLSHRRLMYRNDWIPLKAGLAAASLAFTGFIIFLPELADQPERLRTVCYVAAVLPGWSFLTFFILGLSDRRLMLRVLAESEAGSDPSGRTPLAAAAPGLSPPSSPSAASPSGGPPAP